MDIKYLIKWLFASKPNYIHASRAAKYGHAMAKRAGLGAEGATAVASRMATRAALGGVFDVLATVKLEIDFEKLEDKWRVPADWTLTKPEPKRRQR